MPFRNVEESFIMFLDLRPDVDENAFPIFTMSHLVRMHTDSHNSGHNRMIFCCFLRVIDN